MSKENKQGDLRVWWIPQVPGKPFNVPVATVDEAVIVMETLARYDIFQFENNIKPDYCNAGGLEVFDPEDRDEDAGDGWGEWYDEEGRNIDELIAERTA